MENKYKIVVSYIQDLSVEIPSPETLITIRNTIPQYVMKVDIKSKPGRIVTFPSNMLHYVTPHLEEDKVRYVIAFNQVS